MTTTTKWIAQMMALLLIGGSFIRNMYLAMNTHETPTTSAESTVNVLARPVSNPLQIVWTGKEEIRALLERPECKAAILRARQRQPPNVAMCPLCTRGRLGNSSQIVQYLKVAKAGSSSIVNMLSGATNRGRTNSSKHLCMYQPQNEFTFTLVRHPVSRAVSAYYETDRKDWYKSPKITYRKVKEEPQRFLHFLDDYFKGKMESWDGGMPHHMFSAALTLQAAQEMDRLPDVVGRLEDLPALMNVLNELTGTNLNAPHLLNSDLPDFRDFEAVIAALFEEDFVCFGYPQPELPVSGYNASVESLRFLDYENKSKTVHGIQPPSCSSHYIAHESDIS